MNEQLLKILDVSELRFLVNTMYSEIFSLRKAIRHLENSRKLIEEKEALYMGVAERLSS